MDLLGLGCTFHTSGDGTGVALDRCAATEALVAEEEGWRRAMKNASWTLAAQLVGWQYDTINRLVWLVRGFRTPYVSPILKVRC